MGRGGEGTRSALGEFEHHVLLTALRLGEGAVTAPVVEVLAAES